MERLVVEGIRGWLFGFLEGIRCGDCVGNDDGGCVWGDGRLSDCASQWASIAAVLAEEP